MNKIFSSIAFLSVAALALSSCSREEADIFDDSAINRLDKAETTYKERLQSATAGWAMEYYPTSSTTSPTGNGYLMLTKFNKDMSVDVAMNNAFSNNAFKQANSAWDVIGDNGPVLTFNSYNECLHTFSDPADIPSTTTDETGTGFGGDYEFVVIDAPENAEHVMLKGKKTDVYVRLTRLDDNTNFQEYFTDVKNFTNRLFPSSAPNGLLLTLGDSVYNVTSMASGIPGLYPVKGDSVLDITYHPYLITKHDSKYYLRFRDALTSADGVEEQELVYDEAKDAFVGTGEGTFTLTGPDPTTYFLTRLNNGLRWNVSSSMSDNLKKSYDEVASQFKALKLTFKSIRFQYSNGQLVATVSYNNAAARFKFECKENGANFDLKYLEPYDSGSSAVIARITALNDLFTLLTGTFKCESNGSSFVLNTLKVVNADNADNWIVFSI